MPPDPKWAGRSEEICAKWLAGRPRDAVTIATKVAGPGGGWFQVPVRSGQSALDRHHIERAVEASLMRLHTDYIDLYQTHWPDPNVPIEDTLEALDRLVEQGKVRAIGCSNQSAYGLTKSLWMADRAGTARYETIQNNYSLIARRFEDELAYRLQARAGEPARLQPDRRRRALGQVPGRGLAGRRALLGLPRRPAAQSRDDRSLRERAHAGPRPRASPSVAKQCGLSPVTFAVAWVLTHDFVGSAIIGVTSRRAARRAPRGGRREAPARGARRGRPHLEGDPLSDGVAPARSASWPRVCSRARPRLAVRTASSRSARSSHFVLYQDVAIDEIERPARLAPLRAAGARRAGGAPTTGCTQLLGLEPPRPIEVVIYDPVVFDRQFAGLFRFSAAGFYAGVIRVRGDTVLGVALSRVLHHELVHAALDAAMPSTALPGWLNEGLAEWFEARALGKRRLSERELAVLAHFRARAGSSRSRSSRRRASSGFGPDAAALAYLQSYGMLGLPRRALAASARCAGWSRRWCARAICRRAIQRAFRADLAELEAGFQAELG